MTLQSAPDPLALESLLAFWADAGVDACLADTPTDKLAESPPPPTPAPERKSVGSRPIAAPRIISSDVSAAVADAERLAASVDTLQALEAAVAAWEGVGVRPVSARRPVLARGAAPARVVVIGGPPCADEEAEAAAFAGPSGRLLDRMLAAAGLTGATLCVHLTPWRTPGDRPPTLEEAQAARPLVERAIALANPATLLLLGDAPARLFAGRAEGALKLRGRWLDNVSQASSARTLVTFAPAFLLKQPRAKAQAWSDLLTLAAEVARLRNDP